MTPLVTPSDRPVYVAATYTLGEAWRDRQRLRIH